MQNLSKQQLEAKYTIKIGVLQLEKLKLQITIKGLKRKKELAFQYINKNEHPNFDEIEFTIAFELQKAESDIMEQSEKITDAEFLLAHLASQEYTAELRKIYRTIAKQLHPDVNPEFSEVYQDIWLKIKDAYDTGDLERLKALQIVYEMQIQELHQKNQELSPDKILLQCNTLKEGIKQLEQQIAHIKAQFPFTIAEKLNDKKWVAVQQELLKKELRKLETYEKKLRTEYELLIKTYGTK
jgi:hypothetical protein